MNGPTSWETWHAQLLAGDDLASAELAAALRPELVAHLRRRYPRRADQEWIEDAADDALIAYLLEPEKFDPARASLPAYLKMAAEGDLKNALARQRRREKKIAAGVELDQLGGKPSQADDPTWRLIAEELRGELQSLLPDPRDQALLTLLAEGERSTAVFAEALGLADLPREEQRTEVKRHKDRLKKKLQRYGESHRERE